MENPRLQQIDVLLRAAPVERLRQILQQAERDLNDRNSAIISAIGDSHESVLRCAAAIEKLNSSLNANVIGICESLKATHNDMQQILLGETPTAAGLDIAPSFKSNGVFDLEKTRALSEQVLSKNEIALCNWLQLSTKTVSLLKQSTDSDQRDRVLADTRRLVRLLERIPRLGWHLTSIGRPLTALILVAAFAPELRTILSTRLNELFPIGEAVPKLRGSIEKSALLLQASKFLARLPQIAEELMVSLLPSRGQLHLALEEQSSDSEGCSCPACRSSADSVRFTVGVNLLENVCVLQVMYPQRPLQELVEKMWAQRFAVLEDGWFQRHLENVRSTENPDKEGQQHLECRLSCSTAFTRITDAADRENPVEKRFLQTIRAAATHVAGVARFIEALMDTSAILNHLSLHDFMMRDLARLTVNVKRLCQQHHRVRCTESTPTDAAPDSNASKSNSTNARNIMCNCRICGNMSNPNFPPHYLHLWDDCETPPVFLVDCVGSNYPVEKVAITSDLSAAKLESACHNVKTVVDQLLNIAMADIPEESQQSSLQDIWRLTVHFLNVERTRADLQLVPACEIGAAADPLEEYVDRFSALIDADELQRDSEELPPPSKTSRNEAIRDIKKYRNQILAAIACIFNDRFIGSVSQGAAKLSLIGKKMMAGPFSSDALHEDDSCNSSWRRVDPIAVLKKIDTVFCDVLVTAEVTASAAMSWTSVLSTLTTELKHSNTDKIEVDTPGNRGNDSNGGLIVDLLKSSEQRDPNDESSGHTSKNFAQGILDYETWAAARERALKTLPHKLEAAPLTKQCAGVLSDHLLSVVLDCEKEFMPFNEKSTCTTSHREEILYEVYDRSIAVSVLAETLSMSLNAAMGITAQDLIENPIEEASKQNDLPFIVAAITIHSNSMRDFDDTYKSATDNAVVDPRIKFLQQCRAVAFNLAAYWAAYSLRNPLGLLLTSLRSSSCLLTSTGVPAGPSHYLVAFLHATATLCLELTDRIFNSQSISTYVKEAVTSHLAQAIEGVAYFCVAMVYQSVFQGDLRSTKEKIPLHKVGQALLDLLFAETLLDQQEEINFVKIAEIFRSFSPGGEAGRDGSECDLTKNSFTSMLPLAELRKTLRMAYIQDVVDQVAFSDARLQNAIADAFEATLLMLAPLVSTIDCGSPTTTAAKALRSRMRESLISWKKDSFNAVLRNQSSQYSNAAVGKLLGKKPPRLPLIALISTSTPADDAASRRSAAAKQEGKSLGTALRDGLLSSGRDIAASSVGSNVANLIAATAGNAPNSAALSEFVQSNIYVSNISSFLRGQVEGFSFKVSEAMKARQQGQQQGYGAYYFGNMTQKAATNREYPATRVS